MKIVKSILGEGIIWGVLFVLSFISSVTYMLFLVCIVILAIKDFRWSIKGMIWISIRTVINYGIATAGDGLTQTFKWCVIFALAFIALVAKSNTQIYTRKNTRISFTIALFVFSAYVIIQSIAYSSYPVTSIFKLLSFSIVFYSAVCGVSKIKVPCGWDYYLYICLRMIMILSILVFPIRGVSFSSANLFQGITNQSNMFGVMCALYISLFYYCKLQGKTKEVDNIIAIISIIFLILSSSRNGMLSVVILTVFYFMMQDISLAKKTVIILAGIILVVFILVAFSDLRYAILRYVFKYDDVNAILSGNRDLFESRDIQKVTFEQKFYANKLFGSGFAVRYNNYQDWSLIMSMIVEPGNILYAVLGDLGFIGLFFFTMLYLCILVHRVTKKSILLFAAPFTVCIGEMVFFSTNNMAMLLYIMFGISMYGSSTLVKGSSQ